jgi:hypothetical protein
VARFSKFGQDETMAESKPSNLSHSSVHRSAIRRCADAVAIVTAVAAGVLLLGNLVGPFVVLIFTLIVRKEKKYFWEHPKDLGILLQSDVFFRTCSLVVGIIAMVWVLVIILTELRKWEYWPLLMIGLIMTFTLVSYEATNVRTCHAVNTALRSLYAQGQCLSGEMYYPRLLRQIHRTHRIHRFLFWLHGLSSEEVLTVTCLKVELQ